MYDRLRVFIHIWLMIQSILCNPCMYLNLSHIPCMYAGEVVELVLMAAQSLFPTIKQFTSLGLRSHQRCANVDYVNIESSKGM